MAEQRSFRVETIILRHADWGEADRLLTVYTRQRGKLRLIAKGVRRIHSRKAGHLEPFTHAMLQLARGRDLLIVTQADTLEAYPRIRADLVLTGHAAYLAELVDRFTYEDEAESTIIFGLLADALKRLEQEADPWLAVRFYEVKLLEALGYRPHLFECAHCGREIKAEAQFFSAAQGGALCPNCGLQYAGARQVSVEALKYLRHFQRSDYATAKRAQPEPHVKSEVEALLQHYLTYLLERTLNTPGFIAQVKKGFPTDDYSHRSSSENHVGKLG